MWQPEPSNQSIQRKAARKSSTSRKPPPGSTQVPSGGNFVWIVPSFTSINAQRLRREAFVRVLAPPAPHRAQTPRSCFVREPTRPPPRPGAPWHPGRWTPGAHCGTPSARDPPFSKANQSLFLPSFWAGGRGGGSQPMCRSPLCGRRNAQEADGRARNENGGMGTRRWGEGEAPLTQRWPVSNSAASPEALGRNGDGK